MAKHKSVGERLRRAGSLEVQREIALEWRDDWQRDQADMIRQMERALIRGDIPGAGQYLGKLKALSAKKFEALTGVIDTLAE